MPNRPDWQDYFFDFAKVAATRSTCPRAHVGALIVVENRIVASGYNGSAPGEPHCDDILEHYPNGAPTGIVGCLMEDGHCQRTLHAEVNAIAQCAASGVSCASGTLYIYFKPEFGYDGEHLKPTPGCRECQKVIKAAGINLVICQIGEKRQTFHPKKGKAHQGLELGYSFF